MIASDVCFSKHVDDCAASDDWLQLLSLLMMMMFIRSIANQVDDVLQVATSF